MNLFRPRDLMQGYSLAEQTKAVEALHDTLDSCFGEDEEAKTVILTFLLGQSLALSKISEGAALAMVLSAKEATEEGLE